MNRGLWLVSACLLVAGLAGATTINCSSSSTGLPLDIIGLTVDCDGLTFTNFQVIAVAGNPSPIIDLASVDTTKGVSLTFNPNMSAPPGGGPQDIHLLYEVAGGVSGFAQDTAGQNATIVETACSAPVATTGPTANTCPPGATVLGTNVVYSAVPGQPDRSTSSFTFASSANPVYIFKDIGVSASMPNPAGGALTSFTENFTPTKASTPEPETFILIGPALIALGLLRRRIVKPSGR